MPKQKYSPSTIATVRQLVPIDDVLFQKMSESKKVCQELISTILGKNIKVIDVIQQDSIEKPSRTICTT